MNAFVVKHLNIRQGAPSVNAQCVGYFEPGFFLRDIQKIQGDPINGNYWWYSINQDEYVWSGGLELDVAVEVEVDSPAAASEPLSSFSEKAKNQSLLGWNITSLGIDKIWNDTNFGEGIKVAVLDSGLKTDHPEFSVLKKTTWSALENKEDVTDKMGHGTHCAGIIAAQGEQMMGIAPACELLSVKVCWYAHDLVVENVIAGIEWAAANGADIISMSLVFDKGFPGLDNLHATIKKYSDKIIFIAAAGNYGALNKPVEQYPAAFPECISVGALGRNGSRYRRSNLSQNLTLVAPGENILSAYIDPLYKELSDTSFATPLVSGVLALLLSYIRKNRITLSPAAIIDILKYTCDDVGAPKKDTQHGFGIINPVTALNKIKNATA